MNVTVFYDYNCPFCYIASRRLETLAGEFALKIEWKGIEIHPEFPPAGVRRGRSYRSLRLKQTITADAADDEDGFSLPGFAANSRLALEASEFSKGSGLFSRFHASVFDAYFKEGRNIGDPAVILETGAKSGLHIGKLEDCINRRTMYDKIESNKKEADNLSVLGVPTLILGNFPVHGSQSLDTLRSMIKRAMGRS